ncbi:MAG: hypothetical protein ACYTGR_01040 [Planctomycetota bacterium]|jgi:hypothetical protein
MNRMFRNTLCISSVLVTGSAFANEAVVTIETVAAVPGSTARIGITIDVNDLIGSLDFDAFAGGWIFTDVDYDGPLFDSGWEGWDTTSSAEPNVLAACIFPEDQVTGFQALFTMNIDVPSDAEIGSFRLVDFTDAFVTNYQFTEFDVTVVSGGIDVVDSLCPADLDDSGQVDVKDLVALILDWGVSDNAAADLDGDGIVGVGDLVQLLAAWGTCP